MRKLDYTTQTHSTQILTSLVSFLRRKGRTVETNSCPCGYGTVQILFDDVLLRYAIERVIIDIDNVHNLQL